MNLQLFAHPFSSYCQKVLIALWADGTEFEYRMLDQDHPENMEELERHWPFRPARPNLAAYRARLLAHPVVARAVDEGRPYRPYFPLGAPDRD
ncbi:MAG TPA: glutathione S-transferase N-terminal domain-containing protein [Sphingomicrobium sp.]|nr:glutathione S-transferase N-terminal domain-containing protein [Sphingomicrobium sp.]